MTHEIIMRVAKTICKAEAAVKNINPDEYWCDEIFIPIAYEATKAMREPTEDMNDAGGSVDDAEEFYVGNTTAKAVYQAMIDQVLEG